MSNFAQADPDEIADSLGTLYLCHTSNSFRNNLQSIHLRSWRFLFHCTYDFNAMDINYDINNSRIHSEITWNSTIKFPMV